jgi:hypothetical protein
MYLQISVRQAIGCRKRGKQDIDIHLLKPARFMPDQDYVIPPAMTDHVVQEECLVPAQEYVTYPYLTAHLVLRWLPTKLAEWISSNLAKELKIPEKQHDLWTASELNAIITQNLVGGPQGQLHTFGCIQCVCVNYSMEDQRPDAILSTWSAIVLGTRIQRYKYYVW